MSQRLPDEIAARRSEHIAGIVADLQRGEMSIQPVFPTDPDDVHFAYTIGLWPDHGGEFIVRGFGGQCARVAQVCLGWVLDGTVKLEPGVYQPDPGAVNELLRVDVWWGPVGNFGMAIVVSHHKMEHRELVGPMRGAGRLPGDEGCEVMEFQMKGLPTQGLGA